MLSRFRSRDSAITFDVGTAGIRAFQVTARGARLAKRDSLWLDLLKTSGAGAGQHPTQRANDAPAAPDYSRVARLVGQGDFRGREVGLVLSPPDVRFCALRLPKQALAQTEKRVREALAWEMAREMRSDAHQLEVRHWQLPPRHQQGLNVMAVALPTALATGWHELFARDRLHLRRIDVSPCSLVHLAGRMWTPADDELWGVLDLGFRGTTLTVVLGRVPVYIRPLSISSDSWTRRLAEAFEVAPAGAEQIKRTHGIRPVERGIRTPRPDQQLRDAQDIPGVVFGLLREPLDDLVHEINQCFSYVMQSFPDVNASRLLLAGGGANLSGLGEYLELQLTLPVVTLGNAGADDAPASSWLDTTVLPEQAAAVGSAFLDLEGK